MYVFDVEDINALKELAIEQLKYIGVRCRLPKKQKEEKDVIYYEQQLFQKPLHLLPKCIVTLSSGAAVKVPVFVADACSIIEENLEVEGLFRKAGSSSKQQEMKVELNGGKSLNSVEHHCVNVCSVLKRFFRELPQPILPSVYHEGLLRCLLLSTLEKQVEAILLSCLLLPVENVATLAVFMECLLKVSRHSLTNRMDIKNLAIVLTPTLMPVADQGRAANNLKITHHIRVIELLIEHADKVGQVPQSVEESIRQTARRSRKKRRSGSITRMLSGLKKMVGPRGSATPEWDHDSSSSSYSSARKRKAVDVTDQGLAIKKKHAPETTPLMSRMNSYDVPVAAGSHPVPANLKRVRSRSPRSNTTQRKLLESFRDVGENGSQRNLRKSGKKQKPSTQPSNTELHKLERKMSFITWGRKKASRSNLFMNPDYGEEGEALEMQCFSREPEPGAEPEPEETITIPRSEFEAIKNRVSLLENCISHELDNQANQISQISQPNPTNAAFVQDAYEKTLEHSERLSAEDTLAGRLNRELKIRRSLENKIIRSPSARKIGSIRRRSRELVQKNMEKLARSESIKSQGGAKSTLKRGRPNTLQTGLPSPRSLRATSTLDLTVEPPPTTTRSSVKRSTSLMAQPQQNTSNSMSEWRSGETVFTHKMLAQRLLPTPQGRPSIADIRKHRAGMVLQKTQLFNSLNQSEDSSQNDSSKTTAVPRRQSVRIENMRRSPKKIGTLRVPESAAKENMVGVVDTPVISPNLKETIYQVCTPVAQTLGSPLRELNRQAKTSQVPSIKQSLATRSPRKFTKTPLSALRSQQRGRPTPMRALLDPCGTPRRTPRRSPRILARLALGHL